MSFLAKLLSTFLGSFVDKLLGNVRQWLADRRARADQMALGQAQQANADQAAAIEAAKRMEQAGAGPKGPGETRKMLDEGRF